MKYTEQEKNYIRFILLDRPHLEPIFETSNGIIERIRDYDSKVFMVWNRNKKRYEGHSIESYFPRFKDWTTFQFEIYFDQLDDRVIKYMCRNSITNHGQDLFDELTRENDLMQDEMSNRGRRKIKNSINEVMRTVKGYNTAY